MTYHGPLETLTHPTATSAGAPAVSVILAVFRATEFIGEALESVFAQTFRDYEIIVVNDGCPDTVRLEKVLEPYRGRIVYLRQENAGPSSARNLGIRNARGALVAILDPDDIWEPDYLEVQVATMKKDPAIDVLYPDAIYFGDTPLAGRSVMQVWPSKGEVTFAKLLKVECAVVYSVTARREAMLRAGLYDTALRTSEDFDLWLRIVKNGGRIAYHHRPLLKYRVRAGSLSSDPVWLYQNALKVLEKTSRTMDLTTEERGTLDQTTRDRQAWLELELGKRAFRNGDTEAARVHLDRANRYFRRRKLALVVSLLRHAPWLLRLGARLPGRRRRPLSAR